MLVLKIFVAHHQRKSGRRRASSAFVYDRKNKCWKAVEGVNITLGLPIIRTSVDHGTGFALAGKGESSAESLINAINMAISLL